MNADETNHADVAEQSRKSCHVSVMSAEVVQWLEPVAGGVVFDGTFGGGGHSVLLARAASEHVGGGGRVLAVDRDPAAADVGLATIAGLPIDLFCGSYHQVDRILKAAEVEALDGVVLDLGLSSDQLEDRSRGFSFNGDGPLDLRFDPTRGRSAKEFLAQATEKEIADAIYQFGEERLSRRIAKQIVMRRQERKPVKTVAELVDICRRCVPRSKGHDIHPATRTFQALRILVNEELAILESALKVLPSRMRPGGRIAIISFHSLEDRIVKNAFRDDQRLEPLTRKPLRPSDEEVAVNPRSRSAKMRVAEIKRLVR